MQILWEACILFLKEFSFEWTSYMMQGMSIGILICHFYESTLSSNLYLTGLSFSFLFISSNLVNSLWWKKAKQPFCKLHFGKV